jgi:hypothetical protein
VNDLPEEHVRLELAWRVTRAGKVIASDTIMCTAPANAVSTMGALEIASLDEGAYQMVLLLRQDGAEIETNHYALEVRARTAKTS